MNIPLYRIIDRVVGAPLCLLLGTLSKIRPAPTRKPRAILVIKLWALGDSIISLPMIRALRQEYPDARIDVLCRDRNKAVYQGIKDIDAVRLFEMRNVTDLARMLRQYDAAIDTEPYLNLSALISGWAAPRRAGFRHGMRRILYTDKVPFLRVRHMVLNYLALAKTLGATKEFTKLIPLPIRKEDVQAVDTFMRESGIGPKETIIVMHPCAAESARSRMWPKERYATVADRLIEKYRAKIVLTGVRNEAAYNESVIALMKHKAVNAAGKLSLGGAAELLNRADLAIANDTGTMHLAAAQGTRTIGLFGPNVPSLWAPYGPGNIALYHKVWCSPCIINEKGRAPDCIRTTDRYECMRLISVEEVMEAAGKCLRTR